MVIKTTSVQEVLALTELTIKPTNNLWMVDAIEFIGLGLGIIGYNGVLENKPFEVVVCNNLVSPPCNIEQILNIEYKGVRVPPLLSTKAIKGDNTKISPNPQYWYYLNGKYIAFSDSLNDKLITINGLALQLDEEGYPLVPDTSEHKLALSWFIVYNLLLRGMTHPTLTWKDAFQMWELYYPRAQNKTISMDLDRHEVFKNLWTGWATDFNRAKRFNAPKYTSLNSNEQSINTITQTNTVIVHVEDEDQDDLKLGTNL